MHMSTGTSTREGLRITKIVLGVAACAMFAFGVPASAQMPPPPPPPEIGSEPEVIGGDPLTPSPPSSGESETPATPSAGTGTPPQGTPPQGGQPSSPLPTAEPPKPASQGVDTVKLHGRTLRVRVGCAADGSVTVRRKGKRVGAAEFTCNESTGLARVKLTRKVARRLRTSTNAAVRISLSSGGQTRIHALRLRHGNLAPAAKAAGVDRWDYWSVRAITTPGDIGMAWVYYLQWSTNTQSYWTLVNKQDCTWALANGECEFYTATYYLYRYDYPNRRWLGAYGPYCFTGYACFD
jgi:hypothetical protein